MLKNEFLFIALVVATLLIPLRSFASIIINEIAWAGTTNDWRKEWIELFNDSSSAVDISGWQIDNGASGNKTLVLSGGTIQPNGYFLICRKEMGGCDAVETKMSLHNKYSSNGKLILRDGAGNLIDSTPEATGVTWPGGDNATKHTMERAATGWQTSAQPNGTPKNANSKRGRSLAPSSPSIDEPDGLEPIPTVNTINNSISNVAPQPELIIYPSNIYINEIMPSPKGTDAENEWIEIYNGNDFEINLKHWQIRDTIGAIKTYSFPENTNIQASGFLLIPRPQSKITLQNSGDGLEFLNPLGEVVYSVKYPKAPQGQSYNRQAEAETWQWSTTPTPKNPNLVTQPETRPRAITPQKTEPMSDVGRQTFEKNVGINLLADIGDAINNKTIDNTIENTNIPQTTSRLLLFLLVIAIAIISAIVVLFLKNKTTQQKV